MSVAARKSRAVRPGDLVITVILLAVFVGAYLLAEQWPFRAALFPQLLSAAGALLAVGKLIGFAVRRRGAPADAIPPGTPTSIAKRFEPDKAGIVNEEQEDEQNIEYIFGTAGRREWAAALAWVLGFFLLLLVLGVFITVPVFSFAYLRFAGKASWWGAAIYAAVLGGLLWLIFYQLLLIPMPAGIF